VTRNVTKASYVTPAAATGYYTMSPKNWTKSIDIRCGENVRSLCNFILFTMVSKFLELVKICPASFRDILLTDWLIDWLTCDCCRLEQRVPSQMARRRRRLAERQTSHRVRCSASDSQHFERSAVNSQTTWSWRHRHVLTSATLAPPGDVITLFIFQRFFSNCYYLLFICSFI